MRDRLPLVAALLAAGMCTAAVRVETAAPSELLEAVRLRLIAALGPRVEVCTNGPAETVLRLESAGSELFVTLRSASPAAAVRFGLELPPATEYPEARARCVCRQVMARLSLCWSPLSDTATPLSPIAEPRDGPLAAARAAARQGDLAAAAEGYQALGGAEALCEMANLYRLHGREPQAEAALRLAVAADPDATAPRLALADLLRDMGELPEASTALRRAAEVARTADDLLALAAVARRWGRPEAALDFLSRRLALAADRYLAQLDLARLRLAVGQAGLALELAREAAAWQPDRAEAHAVAAAAEAALGRLGQAIAGAIESLRRPGGPDVATELGERLYWAEAAQLRVDLHLALRRLGTPEAGQALRQRARALAALATALAEEACAEAAAVLQRVAEAVGRPGLDVEATARELDGLARLGIGP